MKTNIISFALVILAFLTSISTAQEIIVYNSSNTPLPGDGITSIHVDASNSKWLGGSNFLFELTNDNWNRVDSGLINEENFFITDIEETAGGKLFVTVGGYPIDTEIYFNNEGIWQEINYSAPVSFPINMSIDDDSCVTFTYNNFWPHQMGNDEIVIYQNEELQPFNPDNLWFITSSVRLTNDTLLVCDVRGINLCDGVNSELINPDGWVPSFVKKIDSDIFVYGKRLNLYKNHSYITYPKIDSLFSIEADSIVSFTIEDPNIFWMGTSNGKLVRYKDSLTVYDITDVPINDIDIDIDNNKWIATNSGCYVFNEDQIVNVKNNVRLPDNYSLSQNYPNPFNPVTTIRYTIPESENVTIKLYDILGREIQTLVNQFKFSGSYEVKIDADNLSSGIYFYRMESGKFSDSRKMIILK